MDYEDEVRVLRPKGANWDRLIKTTMEVTELNREDAEFMLGLLKRDDSEMVTAQLKQLLMTIKMVHADAFEKRNAQKREMQRQRELEVKKREAEEAKRQIHLQNYHDANLKTLEQNRVILDNLIDNEISKWREPRNYNESIDQMDLINDIMHNSGGFLEMVRCGFLWGNIMLTGTLPDAARAKVRDKLQKKGLKEIKQLIPIPEHLFIPKNGYVDSFLYHSLMLNRKEPRYFKDSLEF